MEKKREKPFATKRIHRSGMEVSERASERGKTEKGPDESSENHNSNTKIVNFRKRKVGRMMANNGTHTHTQTLNGMKMMIGNQSRERCQEVSDNEIKEMGSYLSEDNSYTFICDRERARALGRASESLSRNECHYYYTHEHKHIRIACALSLSP